MSRSTLLPLPPAYLPVTGVNERTVGVALRLSQALGDTTDFIERSRRWYASIFEAAAAFVVRSVGLPIEYTGGQELVLAD